MVKVHKDLVFENCANALCPNEYWGRNSEYLCYEPWNLFCNSLGQFEIRKLQEHIAEERTSIRIETDLQERICYDARTGRSWGIKNMACNKEEPMVE